MENQQMNPEYAEDQEQMIAVIAEKANKAQDVITESMAEIWDNEEDEIWNEY